ncbi:cell wall protein IFF6-like [Homarus americanus]|uniref:cell wall protein IFF6-like n=1 Tax=Homarus americanus TaxID=6706 RepID=UPI001C4824BC|nr:cell wall protein IFF6-like [Homarus americanus]
MTLEMVMDLSTGTVLAVNGNGYANGNGNGFVNGNGMVTGTGTTTASWIYQRPSLMLLEVAASPAWTIHLASVPFTGFSCGGLIPGYYADTAPGPAVRWQEHDSFLCPNGTIFNQQFFVCDWWYNFDCSTAHSSTVSTLRSGWSTVMATDTPTASSMALLTVAGFAVTEQMAMVQRNGNGLINGNGNGNGINGSGNGNGLINGSGNGYSNGNGISGNGNGYTNGNGNGNGYANA